MTIPTLGRFERVDLRSVWNSEAASFTPWLAQKDNLDLLSDALGLPPLETVSVEEPVGPFRADIVARVAGAEELVLIENQIERSDHIHFGQILTYAAGLRAAHVIWIARAFTDEHRAAFDWLNEITSEHFNFFAVEIEAWRIGDSAPAPRFNAVAKPNEWTRAVSTSARRSAPEGIDVNRVEYWRAFAEVLRPRSLPLTIKSEPPRLGYYSFTLSRSRQVYLYVYRDVAKQKIGAYIGIYGPRSKEAYEQLHSQTQEIEFLMGEPLKWEVWKENLRYYISVEPTVGDAMDEADWIRQHNWMCDKLEKFVSAFQSRMNDLD